MFAGFLRILPLLGKNSKLLNQKGLGGTDFRDTLLVLATVEDSPGYPARVLALEEKRLGLSVLEAEDLAVATDEQLTLYFRKKKTPVNQPFS